MTHSHGQNAAESDDRKVGRIALGTRRFAVVLMPAASGEADALCRFELAGQSLAVIETGDARGDEDGVTEDLAIRLTGRELEIAALVAHGHANKVIAHRLRISEWTVATYLRRIFLKLGVESRAAMVFRCAPLLKRAVEPRPGPGDRRKLV